MKAVGTFQVELKPLENYAEGKEGMRLGRMSIDKTFVGDLSGSSQGEMLSAVTTTEGSAGYVAIEQFVGELGGKSGSFVLQHFGIMNRGDDRLVLEVVPDSATGALVGLSGTMQILIEQGEHRYLLDYVLP